MLTRDELKDLVSIKLKEKFKLRKPNLEKMENEYKDTIDKYCEAPGDIFLQEEADFVSSIVEIKENMKAFEKRYVKTCKQIDNNLKPKEYSLIAYKMHKDKYTQEVDKISAGIK